MFAQDIGNVQMNIVGSDPWRPDTETITRYYRQHEGLVGKVSDKLQRFDLGIENMVPQSLPDGTWLLTFTHHGLDTPVVLGNESAGTRHLVHVFPQLHFVLDTGHLALMDALDTDFHTELAVEILGWFRRKETNPNKAQLICSLHNLSVLEGLEKEEVFIVEEGSRRRHPRPRLHAMSLACGVTATCKSSTAVALWADCRPSADRWRSADPFLRRRRVFIGAEGESERSLAKWLGRLCKKAGLHVHLDVIVCGGGDSFAVATHAVDQYRKRSKAYGEFSAGLVLLDADRLEETDRVAVIQRQPWVLEARAWSI